MKPKVVFKVVKWTENKDEILSPYYGKGYTLIDSKTHKDGIVYKLRKNDSE